MTIDQLERPAVDQTMQTRGRNSWAVAGSTFAAVLIIGVAWGVLAGGSGGSPLGPENRPATPVKAVLGAEPNSQAYFARTTEDFDAAIMGVQPGAVTAEWYRAEGFYVVFFAGVDTEAAPGLCPSAYVLAGGQPDYMANAAAGGADCSAIVINELPDPAVRTMECNAALALRTAIPEGTTGMLHASLERPVPTSSGGTGIMGLLGMRPDGGAEVPEVDVSMFEC